MQTNRGPSDIESMFLAVERANLRLAIKGRMVTILVVGCWLIWSRGTDRLVGVSGGMAVLAILGWVHFRIIGSKWNRSWVKYIFVALDFLLLSSAVALISPNPSLELPQVFMFRFDTFHYYYVALAVAAFSFSPGLVMFAGMIGAVSWLAAFAWVRAGVGNPLEWADATQSITPYEFLSVFLNPSFVGTGSRIQEAILFLVVSSLIALVMQQSRQIVRRQITAERDMTQVSQMFGRFVPDVVARTMIQDRGVLDPVEREASILFLDIAEFTKMTEAKGPQDTVKILNAFFDMATDIIARHQGVVTQFQGDAILAVFNVPIANEAHARCAFDAASDILRNVGARNFMDQRISVRIGLNSGPVIAGNVGGGGRQSYTVHGDAVNIAARLEALNKEYGTAVLLSRSIADALSGAPLRAIGEVAVQGHSKPIEIFTLDQPAG